MTITNENALRYHIMTIPLNEIGVLLYNKDDKNVKKHTKMTTNTESRNYESKNERKFRRIKGRVWCRRQFKHNLV